jgi:hypothetical protein
MSDDSDVSVVNPSKKRRVSFAEGAPSCYTYQPQLDFSSDTASDSSDEESLDKSRKRKVQKFFYY